MYLLFLVLLPLLLFLLILNHFRKKKIIQKIEALCTCEKCTLLNELLIPFGYTYILSQDLFSTRKNSWQRSLGYCALYDKEASRLGMVFDYVPIYFDYRDRTWLLEIWKGQYGITTGGEIGLYHADRLLEKSEYQTTLFQSAADTELLPMHLTLTRKEKPCINLEDRHWWLAGFRLGLFSHPEELTLSSAVTFPNTEMANAFLCGLTRAGYSAAEWKRSCNTIFFPLTHALPTRGTFRRLRAKIAQCSNRLGCRIYCCMTRYFSSSLDRALYLYYYLPFAFRKILRLRKVSRSRRHT